MLELCQVCQRDIVTPLLGPLPDIRRCIDTDKGVRARCATSMQNNAMNLDAAILAYDTMMITMLGLDAQEQ